METEVEGGMLVEPAVEDFENLKHHPLLNDLVRKLELNFVAFLRANCINL